MIQKAKHILYRLVAPFFAVWVLWMLTRDEEDEEDYGGQP